MVGIVEDELSNTDRDFLLSQVVAGDGTSYLGIVDLRHALDDAPLVVLEVIVAAHEILSALALLAGQRLIEKRMVDLLLPAVAASTERLERTPLVVIANESSRLPVLAKIPRIVIEEVRLAAEVLPVVGVDALRLVVLVVLERAPLGLEVENEKVLIARVSMDEPRLDVKLRVSEGAELTVGTLLKLAGAELGLVLLDVVETLNVAVSKLAGVAHLALVLGVSLAEV